MLNRNDQSVPALRVDMSLVYIHEFVGFSYLFYQPVDEKIKTWTPRRFPAEENPNIENAMFDWPIALQYDVKAKYRLISRKHEDFSPERSLSHARLYPFDKPIKSFYSFRLFSISFLFSIMLPTHPLTFENGYYFIRIGPF